MISYDQFMKELDKGYIIEKSIFEKNLSEYPPLWDDKEDELFVDKLYSNIKDNLLNNSIASIINEDPSKLFNKCMKFCCMRDEDRIASYAEGEYIFFRELVGDII